MNGKAFLTATSLALALGSGSALAAKHPLDATAPAPKPKHHAMRCAATAETLSPAAEIAMVEGATYTPTQAAAAAERYVGGKAVAIGARQESGAPRYSVDVLVGERVARVYVDPKLGTADGTTWLGPVAAVFPGFDQASMEALLARRTLPDAIAEA